MTTKRESILAAIATLLGPTSGVSGRVYRSRAQALRLEETPAILIEPVSDDHQLVNLSYLECTLQVRVMVVTRGAIPDQLADPIIESAHSLLMADRDLGGLALDTWLLNTRFSIEEGDGNVGLADMTIAVKYRTAQNNLGA